jgi:hypothetical protein
MSDTGKNCFDEKDSSSDEDKKAAGNQLEQFKNVSDDEGDNDQQKFGSKKQIE